VVWLLPLLVACEAVTATDDEVSWSGWVYVDQDRDQVLAEGTVDFQVEGEAEPVPGEQPYADSYPGYWEALLPPGEPVNVRVAAEGAHPTWWAGDVPTTRGTWFGGALFAVTDTFLATVASALGESGDEWANAATTGVVVLGYPANDDIRCGDLAVGPPAAGEPPACWAVDESGVVSRARSDDAVAWFLAAVEPGTVVVEVAGARETWEVAAGDIVMPWFLVGGGS
jgi:hypothetical protein